MSSAAALDMLKAEGTWGSGAGSFRYLFPLYQQHYPAIYKTPQGGSVYWEHAHNDIYEFPIELGIVGTLILIGGLGWWVFQLIRLSALTNVLSISIIASLAGALVHARFDFPFQNPAVLMTWCCLWPAVALWSRSDHKNARS
jgi:O-antigen ligase